MTYSDYSLNARRKTWQEEREVLQIIGAGIDVHFALFRQPWKLAMPENNRQELVARFDHKRFPVPKNSRGRVGIGLLNPLFHVDQGRVRTLADSTRLYRQP